MPLGPDSAVFSPFEDGHSEPDQRELLTVAAIWFAAIMLRLFNLLEIRDRDPFFHQPSVDPAFYHDWAMQIVGGNWLGEGVFLQGPLYPYLLSLLYSLTGPNLFLPRFLNCIVGSFVCVLVWHVAREVFGRRTALVASGMTAVYGMLIFYEGSLLIANIALPLNLLVVGSTLRALRAPSTKSWFVVGALIGIAALARPNMLLYAPAAFVMLLAFVAEPQTWAQKRGWAAFLILGTCLAIAPSAIRNYAVTGDAVLITASAGMNFYNGNNPDANGSHKVPRLFDRSMADHPLEQNKIYKAYAEHQLQRPLMASEVSSYWMGKGFEYVRENPADWLRLLGVKSLYFINAHEIWNNRSYKLTRQFSWVLALPLLGFAVVGPLAMLGLIVSGSHWRKLAPLYSLLLVYFATCVIFFVVSRYRVPAVPILIIFAAAGVVWLYDAARIKRMEFGLAILALGLFTAASNVELGNEDLSVAYYNLANKYRLQGNHEEAIEQYRVSLDINEHYISAHNNLAISLELSGTHREEAIGAWRHLREMGRKRGLARYVERAQRHLAALGAPE